MLSEHAARKRFVRVDHYRCATSEGDCIHSLSLGQPRSTFGKMGAALIFLAAACLGSRLALAEEINLTAEFRPSALDSTNSRFVNTTPVTGICANSGVCQYLPEPKSFASSLVINFDDMPIKGAALQSAYLGLPGSFRRITVTDERGRTAEVDWRAILVGGTYVLPVDVRLIVPDASDPLIGHQRLWGGASWVYPEGGCRTSGFGSLNVTAYSFAWLLPEGDQECFKTPSYAIPGTTILQNFSLGYEMKTPNPLAMSNGIYRGSLDLHVGPGRDFYFGERGTASHSVITLNFELTVAHDFQVSFPPGSDRVVLQPVGGWAPWIDHGHVPGALKNEIPFTVSSSAPFSIALQCQYPVGDQCGIRSDSDDTEVPIEVAISMPGINAMATSTPAMRQRLDTRGRMGFHGANGYVAHRPSRLHVGVSGQPLAAMLKQLGSHWRGQVTVIFDTEL